MYQVSGIDDTIAAISTAVGPGAIGIVRLSGPDAVPIADAVFVGRNRSPLAQAKSHTVHYGVIVDDVANFAPGKPVIDEVLCTLMRAPRSYTREDVIEISCHGGITAQRAILALMLDHGARLAEPGEFTKRAFLNGRIDLVQAEAVLDIIQSRTAAFLKVSSGQLQGELTQQLALIRAALLDIYTRVEAVVNFPDDETGANDGQAMTPALCAARQRIERLLATADQGRLLKEGIKIVICGRPNVGKSSLLNILLRQPRAIVSEVAGTTRDIIEESAQIDGIPFRLVDTAGILEPRDLVEKEAVRRSRIAMREADLILWVLDGSQPLTDEDRQLWATVHSQKYIVVLNKSDLPASVDAADVHSWGVEAPVVSISARQKETLPVLEQALVASVRPQASGQSDGLLVSNLRHVQSLKDAREALLKAEQLCQQRLPTELISEEIKIAINTLDAITGRNIDQDLLDTIFSSFCIGK